MGIIKKLQVKGLIGIKEKVLFPGKINILKGKNGTGKTTLLEAIKGGTKNDYDRIKVINDNAKEAEIIIETDDNLEIRRRITDKKNPVTIKENGFKKNAPQTFLDELVGKYSFNPVKFLKADPEKQTKILLDAMPIEVTPDQVKSWVDEIAEGEPIPGVDYSDHGLEVLKRLEKMYYNKRHEQNGVVDTIDKELVVEKAKVPDDFDPEKYRGVSLKDKYTELNSLKDKNEKIEKYKRFVEEMDRKITETAKDRDNAIEMKEAEIARLEEKIKELKAGIEKDKDNYINKVIGYGNEDGEKVDGFKIRKEKAIEWLEAEENQPIEEEKIQELDKEIEEFQENQKLVDTYDKVQRLEKEFQKETEQAEKLDKLVALFRSKPKELIDKADIPIEGLEIRDGIVYVNDRPVKDYSGGESVILAVKFARAIAKDFKVILFDEILSLDPDNIKVFMEEIKDDDYQYWITEPTADPELIIEAITEAGVKMNAETGEVIEEAS